MLNTIATVRFACEQTSPISSVARYRIWSDNVYGDLYNRGFPAKTNQNMCHCVKTFQNLVRGRGKFNVCEEIISLQ